MTARITLDRLEGVCKQQRLKFQEIFPNGFEATSQAECIAVAREHVLAFDWDLAASRLLTGPERKDYISVEASAWEVYDAAKRQARKTYKDAKRKSQEDYENAKRQARKDYENAKRPVMKAYKSVCADAFARAFWAQETKL